MPAMWKKSNELRVLRKAGEPDRLQFAWQCIDAFLPVRWEDVPVVTEDVPEGAEEG